MLPGPGLTCRRGRERPGRRHSAPDADHRQADPGHAPVALGRQAGLPSWQQQIKVLTAVLNRMHKHYRKFAFDSPGPQDIFDYGTGNRWRRGIDGAGTTIAVIEGWHFTGIAKLVAGFDKVFGRAVRGHLSRTRHGGLG